MPWPPGLPAEAAGDRKDAAFSAQAFRDSAEEVFKQLDDLARGALRDILDANRFANADKARVLGTLDESFLELLQNGLVTSSVFLIASYPNTEADSATPCHEHA